MYNLEQFNRSRSTKKKSRNSTSQLTGSRASSFLGRVLGKVAVGYRAAACPDRNGSLRPLHSTERFSRMLHRERTRALRSGQPFCLIRFMPLERPTTEIVVGHIVNDLDGRLEDIDEIGWLDERCIGVVLPYTLPRYAWKLADDVCDSFVNGLPRPTCEVFSYPSGKPVEENGKNGDFRESLQNINGRNGDAHNPTSGVVQGMEPFFVQAMPLWKRGIDIIGSVMGLLLASPVLLSTAVAIHLTSPGPVFFRQQRSGTGNRPFLICKFRTMYAGAEKEKDALQPFSDQEGPAFKMTDDPRVTPLGRFLRKTSIDELPQFWNVLKGDMSLVGPRPLPCDESEASDLRHQLRLDVTPGITCIWQVNGRSTVSFDEWARMDLDYIRTRSLLQDVKLLLQTIPAVLSRKGAS